MDSLPSPLRQIVLLSRWPSSKNGFLAVSSAANNTKYCHPTGRAPRMDFLPSPLHRIVLVSYRPSSKNGFLATIFRNIVRKVEKVLEMHPFKRIFVGQFVAEKALTIYTFKGFSISCAKFSWRLRCKKLFCCYRMKKILRAFIAILKASSATFKIVVGIYRSGYSN